MADRTNRSDEEREAARRARDARRDRDGRRPVFEEAVDEFHADPPRLGRDGSRTPPRPTPEPPLAEPPPATPPAAVPPAAVPSADIPAPAPAPAAPARRPIRSFPSTPDPAFYRPDDQLDDEAPAGTRRVARGQRRAVAGRPGVTGAGEPPSRGRGASRAVAGAPRRRWRWLGRAVALLALLIAGAIIWFLIALFQPFGSSPHGRVTVRIAPSTGSSTVARKLADADVLSSRRLFEVRIWLSGDRSRIRAGTYRLRKGMSYGTVLSVLTRVPKAVATSEFTLAEGHTRQYVAKLLRRQHVRGSYLAATRASPLLHPRRYGAPRSTKTLEGFLFPDTFQLVDPPKISALVHDQLVDFKRRFATVNLAAARRRHQNAFQVLTIASLIEAESASPRDDRLVASVIDNRLRDGMMLQLDSTARYATGNFTGPLLQSQLDSRSPYNTHTHFGLPPGPIDSPGLTAIQAAANPARSPDLYFFSKPCTDRTVFATSYAQFQELLLRDKRPHCPK